MVLRILAAFAAIIAVTAEVRVDSVSPEHLQGSTAGGTLLRLRGSGFFRDGREGVTTVFIVRHCMH